MKIIIKKDKLLKVLSRVQSIADRKSSMAILSTILFETLDKEIKISATDLEIGYIANIEAEIQDKGALAIPARKFYEIIKEFPKEDIIIEEKDPQWLTIYEPEEEVIFKLSTLSAEDFPSLPNIEGIKFFEIDGEILSEMISKTIFCVATEESRFILSGLYVEKTEEDPYLLRFVSTDGHRLALIEKRVDTIENLNLYPGIIIPRKAALEIKKIAKSQNLIKIGVKENHIITITDKEILTARLIDGQYPDYKTVIPKEKIRVILANRKQLLEALKRVSLISTERYKPIKLEVNNNLLTIISQHLDLGEGKEKIPIKYNGEDFFLNFNAKYLIDILEVMVSENIELSMNNESTPCVITGPNDEGFIGLVMPMTTV